MEKRARHRPKRAYPNAARRIYKCPLERCPHCGQPLHLNRNWHMHKTIQTLHGPLFVAGRSKTCGNPACSLPGEHYFASQVLSLSLPGSSYGLDVLAYIGWEHEQEHRQLVEIQRELNRQGIEVNERNVGKLYRQFLALLGGVQAPIQARLEQTIQAHGGLILGLDALKPEGSGHLLYVVYEVQSMSVLGALQVEPPLQAKLVAWLGHYAPYPVLATLSDGEETLVAALRRVWPLAPHQRCQEHFLGNLAADVLPYDSQLRQRLRADFGGLPPSPLEGESGPPFLKPPAQPRKSG
jgi:hypothetical protein